MPASYPKSATLKLVRSNQSGSKTMPDAAGTWLICFVRTYPSPFLFGGGKVDLTNMLLGDTVEVELAEIVVSGGSYIVSALNPYNGAQAVPLKLAPESPNRYGYRVRVRQTAGVARSFYMEFWEAVRR